MATLTEDDVLEQLDAQDNLFSFMKTAHTILLQGIRQFLPSLFVDNFKTQQTKEHPRDT